MSDCPHCYCQDTEVNGRPHVACCMCEVRKLLSYRLPIWTDYGKTANATTPEWLKGTLIVT